MRFEIPGLTCGPTDQDLERLEKYQLVVKSPSDGRQEEEVAARLGLSVQAYRALQESLKRLQGTP